MHDCMLTTMDNPWNPFTQPREWYNHDHLYGYNTEEWIASLSFATSDMDDEMIEAEIDLAMNDLLIINPFGIHFKVYREEADDLIPLANKAYREMMSNLKD